MTQSRGGYQGQPGPPEIHPDLTGEETHTVERVSNLTSGLHLPKGGPPLSGDKTKGVPATSRWKNIPLKNLNINSDLTNSKQILRICPLI